MLKHLLYNEERSRAEIGREFGVSRERIRQLEKEYCQTHSKLFQNPSKTITELELRNFLKARYTQKEIALFYQCSPKTVARYQKAWGLKKLSASQILPPEKLRQLVLEEGLDDVSIAKEYQFSPSTIEKLRQRYGIKVGHRRASQLRQRLNPDVFHYLYIEIGATLNQISEITGLCVTTVKKLRQEYSIKKQRAKGISPEKVRELQVLWKVKREGDVIHCEKKENPASGHILGVGKYSTDRMPGKKPGKVSNPGKTSPHRLSPTNPNPH